MQVPSKPQQFPIYLYRAVGLHEAITHLGGKFIQTPPSTPAVCGGSDTQCCPAASQLTYWLHIGPLCLDLCASEGSVHSSGGCL